MIRYSRRVRLFAACLSALAGFTDALGFIALGGFFVSFMSGNSTRLAVGAAGGSSDALIALGLIAAFVAGVMVGAVVGHRAGARRRPVVLVAVAALLAIGAALAAVGWMGAGIAFVAMAMGAENAVFERDGEVSIGLTYMTGTLVKLGQRLAAALTGRGEPWAWLPYLLLWLGLVSGAVLGALTYRAIGLGGLWIAAGVALALAAVAARMRPDAA